MKVETIQLTSAKISIQMVSMYKKKHDSKFNLAFYSVVFTYLVWLVFRIFQNLGQDQLQLRISNWLFWDLKGVSDEKKKTRLSSYSGYFVSKIKYLSIYMFQGHIPIRCGRSEKICFYEEELKEWEK